MLPLWNALPLCALVARPTHCWTSTRPKALSVSPQGSIIDEFELQLLQTSLVYNESELSTAHNKASNIQGGRHKPASQWESWLKTSLFEVPDNMPHAQDIWNGSLSWVNVTIMHPAGVISNVNGNKVVWADVNFISLNLLYILSLAAYPVILVIATLCLTVTVSMCLTQKLDQQEKPDRKLPLSNVVSVSSLTPRSKWIYWYWTLFCRSIPALMVFGVPCTLVGLSYPYPQEVFVLLVVVSSVVVFSNSLYLAFFVPFMLRKIHTANKVSPRSGLDPSKPDIGKQSFEDQASQRAKEREFVHWVVVPNYKEEEETLMGSVDSIAQSMVSKSQICVLLAMESREAGSKVKAASLVSKYHTKFLKVETCFHPPDLPNDPPGKASNMKWAFNWLSEHFVETNQDTSKVILTVSDADSDFHKYYFDSLTQAFATSSVEKRCKTLWQCPIFHVKNYHRQPMPLTVGTMYTAMSELAVLSDPNSIRFPYSTYSLSYTLAEQVGGWDAEWIAEDWHMGIKCFLLTLGETQVEPIFSPCVNYMPEDNTWWGTIHARWSQAKRHALGFSDLSYYFMMMPLIHVHLSKVGGMRSFWKLFVQGISYLVRLINTHVIIGVMALYMLMSILLKHIMQIILGDLRQVGELFHRSTFAMGLFTSSSVILAAIVTINFQVLYWTMRDRMEPAATSSRRLFDIGLIHGIYNLIAFLSFSTMYCFALAACIWIAAVKVLTQKSFEYEVASKPCKDKQHSTV